MNESISMLKLTIIAAEAELIEPEEGVVNNDK